MQVGDLKRAVEDVILRPDENRLCDVKKRSTIAALDLCEGNEGASANLNEGNRNSVGISSSGEQLTVVSVERECGSKSAKPTMSSSLDTVVLKKWNTFRHYGGQSSQRSSRAHPRFATGRRNRSNSASSCIDQGLMAGNNEFYSLDEDKSDHEFPKVLLEPNLAQCSYTGYGCPEIRGWAAANFSARIPIPSAQTQVPFGFKESDERFHSQTLLNGGHEARHCFTSSRIGDPPLNCSTKLQIDIVCANNATAMNSKINDVQQPNNQSLESAAFMEFRHPVNLHNLYSDEEMDCD